MMEEKEKQCIGFTLSGIWLNNQYANWLIDDKGTDLHR